MFLKVMYVCHLIAIGEFKLELKSINAKIGAKLAILCDLEFWRMT